MLCNLIKRLFILLKNIKTKGLSHIVFSLNCVMLYNLPWTKKLFTLCPLSYTNHVCKVLIYLFICFNYQLYKYEFILSFSWYHLWSYRALFSLLLWLNTHFVLKSKFISKFSPQKPHTLNDISSFSSLEWHEHLFLKILFIS